MVNLILPKIEIEALTQNYGRFAISPLEKGFGITLGNALRRVLLSSLNGAAITSIKVDGVHHDWLGSGHRVHGLHPHGAPVLRCALPGRRDGIRILSRRNRLHEPLVPL